MERIPLLTACREREGSDSSRMLPCRELIKSSEPIPSLSLPPSLLNAHNEAPSLTGPFSGL